MVFPTCVFGVMWACKHSRALTWVFTTSFFHYYYCFKIKLIIAYVSFFIKILLYQGKTIDLNSGHLWIFTSPHNSKTHLPTEWACEKAIVTLYQEKFGWNLIWLIWLIKNSLKCKTSLAMIWSKMVSYNLVITVKSAANGWHLRVLFYPLHSEFWGLL